jgi:hypothetical protein
VRSSKVCLTNYLGGNADGEVLFKQLLTFNFENGRVNHSMLIEYKGPSGVVFWECFWLVSKIELYPTNMHCKTLHI